MGRRIADLRRQAGMTSVAFAEAAGMSPAYAWRVEAGRQNLNLVSLSRIAIALDVPLTAIFDGIEADPESLGTRPYVRRTDDDAG